MSRTYRPYPDELNPRQLEIYQAIAGGPRAAGRQAFSLCDAEGRLRGPFSSMLLNPSLGDPLQQLGAALRYQGSLPGRARELVILAVAAERRSPFEQEAHEAVGREVGLTETELAALRDGEPLTLTDPTEAAALEAARLLARHQPIDDQTYDTLTTRLSAELLFEVVALVGYYALLADLLRIFAPDE